MTAPSIFPERVGNFESVYPLQVLLTDAAPADELIKTVKEQIHKIPGNGTAYGVLKYINNEPALQGADPFDVLFQFIQSPVVDNGTEGSTLQISETNNAYSLQSSPLTLTCFVRGDELIFKWSYDLAYYNANVVKSLSEMV